MESSRWWHVAVVATAIVLGVLAVLDQQGFVRTTAALVALGCFVLAWFLVGRHAPSSPRAATAFIVITIAVAGIGTSLSPSLATIQTLAYPIIWVMSRRVTSAVLANIALATAVGIGLYLSVGDLPQALLIQGVSLVFSLSLGLWITNIADRSHERQQLLDELRSTQARLAAVNRDAGVASERERLAREIHDTIAQDLTGLVLLTQRARQVLAGGTSDATLDEQLELLEDNARSALAETRALVAATAPVGLATGGIGDALDRLGARFTRETGVEVTVRAAGLRALDRDTEVVLLRCAQEGLANVRKHAEATAASVSVDELADAVTLEVADNGRGFDTTATSGGYGLAGIADRLALVDGTLHVDSSASGTTLRITLPVSV